MARQTHQSMLGGVLVLLMTASSVPLRADQHNLSIGRLNHAGFSEAQHCTVTLIGERIAVSARHCMIDGDVTEMHLLLGYDRGDWHEHLRPLSAITPDPSADIAVLCLDDAGVAEPVAVAAHPTGPGEEVLVVGYGRPTVYVANETICHVTAVYEQGAFEMDCPLSPGDSGAPVLRATNQGYEVVGIVSGTNSTGSIAYRFDDESNLRNQIDCSATD